MFRSTLVLFLMSFALAGCALHRAPSAGSGGPATSTLPDGEPTRVRTSVGSFEIQARNADLLRRMLAGEAVEVQFYAGSADL